VAFAAALLAVSMGMPVGPRATRAADDPFVTLLGDLALENGQAVVVDGGAIATLPDVDGFMGAPDPGADLLNAGVAELDSVPPYLLERLACGGEMAACPTTGSEDAEFSEGAYLFFMQLAQAPAEAVRDGVRYEWGPLLVQDEYRPAPLAAGDPFSGGTHAVIVRLQGTARDVLYFANATGEWQPYRTTSRAMWQDDVMIVAVPRNGKEIQRQILAWDPYAFWSQGTPETTGRDNIRGFDGAPMPALDDIPKVAFAAAPNRARRHRR
jgi:hypothetical protein